MARTTWEGIGTRKRVAHLIMSHPPRCVGEHRFSTCLALFKEDRGEKCHRQGCIIGGLVAALIKRGATIP